MEKINVQLSELGEKFEQNTIDSRADFYYDIDDEKVLEDMPESDKQMALQEAKAKKSKSKYRFTLAQPSYIAIIRYCKDAKIREKFYKANHQIASTGKWDNRPIALKILKLREEKAKLLGFKNYTEYVLQERMAPSSQAIEKLLNEVGKRAKSASKRNIEALKSYSGQKAINDWDLSYYSEKLKKEKYSVDDKLLRPYFPLDQVINGFFGLMKLLFGIEVKQKKKKSYHPEVRVYEVYDQGKLISYYLLDPFARPEKRGGAWANDLRTGWVDSEGKKMIPIVINVCNFAKGIGKQPPLLTHRDVETLFHEFGHAIHLMLSSQNLTNLNGFHTEWDFVEMPSQILENWCWEEKSLNQFAKHFETGKPIPAKWIKKLKASQSFMSGLFLSRQNEFGFLDLLLHSQKAPKTVSDLDKRAYKIANQHSALPKFKGHKMYASFGHIFAGGYAAGYYSYVWAEVLEADIFAAIKKQGAMSSKVGRKYAHKILRQGTKKPASQLVEDFLGRKPNTKAFFRKHGV